MDEFEDSTAIIRSLKDLNQFLGKNKPKLSSSPRQKLTFSDSFNDTRTSGLDQSFHNDSTSCLTPGRAFYKRQQDSVVGFDVAKKLREKDVELINAQKIITHLESRISELQTTVEKDALTYETELNNLRSVKMRDKEIIDELKRTQKHLETREKEAIECKLQTQSSADARCAELMVKLNSMQKEQMDKDEQYFNETNKLKNNIFKLEKELKEASISKFSDEYSILQEQRSTILIKAKTYEESQHELETLRLSTAKMESKILQLQNSLKNVEEFKKKEAHYENIIVKMSYLEKENNKLKDDNSTLRIVSINSDLLNEKLSMAEEQNKFLNSRCHELVKGNTELAENHKHCQLYEEALQECLGLSCMPPVHELKELLNLLMKGDKELCETIQVLKESIKSHETTREKQEEMIRSYKVQLVKNQDDISRNSHTIRSLQRKLMLVSKERDNLKGIVKSYESESTIVSANHDRERLSQLESDLESYKAEVSRLEKEVDNLQGSHSDTASLVNVDNRKITELEKRIDELVKNNNQILQEKEALETKLEHQKILGGYDPNTTRVLEFKDNPAAKVKDEKKVQLERLQKENEVLKSRVKLLESGETMDITLKAGGKAGIDAATSKQLTELQEKNSSLEKQNQRLIEIFKQKTSELRETVYRLTGYRIDLKGENYKVSSMFADSEEEYLMFEQTRDGELHMLQTDYSDVLEVLVDTYLHKGGSFPAFLSALTLELYNNNRTLVQSPQPSSASEQAEEEEEVEDDEELEDEDAIIEDEEQANVEEEEHLEDEEIEEDHDERGEGGEEYEEEEEEDEELPDSDEEDDPPAKRFRQESQDSDDDDLICLD